MIDDRQRPDGVRHALAFRALCHVARCLDGCAAMIDRGARAMIHLAAGTLTLAELRRGIASVWDDMQSADAGADLMPWEERWYRRWLKPDDHILIVGCGSGRDLVALLGRGYRVDGLDVAPRAVEVARDRLRRRGLAAEVRLGSLDAVELSRAYDVIIFSFFAYSYIPQSDVRVAVLRRGRAGLAPGGRLLVTYIAARRPPSRLLALTRFAGRLSRTDWRVEGGDCIGPLIGRPPSVHLEHHFTREEIEREARTAGLTIADHRNVEEGMLVLTDGQSPRAARGDV
jgi:SAM-dependent methyltransferase